MPNTLPILTLRRFIVFCHVNQTIWVVDNQIFFLHISIDDSVWIDLIIVVVKLIWAITVKKRTVGHVRQRSFKSACVFRSLIRIFTERVLVSKGCKHSSRGQRWFWSDCGNTQADLSLRWTQSQKVRFLTLPLIEFFVHSSNQGKTRSKNRRISFVEPPQIFYRFTMSLQW